MALVDTGITAELTDQTIATIIPAVVTCDFPLSSSLSKMIIITPIKLPMRPTTSITPILSLSMKYPIIVIQKGLVFWIRFAIVIGSILTANIMTVYEVNPKKSLAKIAFLMFFLKFHNLGDILLIVPN